MFTKLDLARAIFIDIETVPEWADHGAMSPAWQEHWRQKWTRTRTARYKHVFEGEAPPGGETDLAAEAAIAYREAGLYAEFGKIVCVTLGRFHEEGGYQGKDGQAVEPGSRHFVVTSIFCEDEEALLTTLGRVLSKENYSGKRNPQKDARTNRPLFDYDYCLVGHNIKEFDIPYLCRRMLVNAVCIPELIDCSGLKPWEVKHLVDTLELWKFGDYKAYTSLDLLMQRFGLPSPKQDMSGAGVYEAYLAGDLERIGRYCALDVVAVADLMLRWRREEPLDHTLEVETQMKPLIPAMK